MFLVNVRISKTLKRIKKKKLSVYFTKFLEDKNYIKVNGHICLSFTPDEARSVLKKAMRVAHGKKDIKEFLACIKEYECAL